MIMGVVVSAQPRGEDDIGIRARVRVQKSKVRRFTSYNHFLSLFTRIQVLILRMLVRLHSPVGDLGCRFQGHTSKLNLILYLEKESANW